VLIWIWILQLYLSTTVGVGAVRGSAGDPAGTGEAVGTSATGGIDGALRAGTTAPSVTTSPPVKTPTP